MKRLSSLLTKYNIGAETLIFFLVTKGYGGELSLSTKLDNYYLSLIDKEFFEDLQAKEAAQKIEFTETSTDRLYKKINALKSNQTIRIAIDAGQDMTYKNIFGQCFWGCKEVRCIDPYIREWHQVVNLKNLLHMIEIFSLNQITFYLTTCTSSAKNTSKYNIENDFKGIEADFKPQILFHYTIEEEKYYHDRHIYVDNKYIIDLTRGLDIFDNYLNEYNSISKNCTVFITKI